MVNFTIGRKAGKPVSESSLAYFAVFESVYIYQGLKQSNKNQTFSNRYTNG